MSETEENRDERGGLCELKMSNRNFRVYNNIYIYIYIYKRGYFSIYIYNRVGSGPGFHKNLDPIRVFF